MADGAARSSKQFDTTMAYADQMLYDAIFNSFYGELTFVMKAGRIVLVRKHETVIPTTSERIDGGEAISEDSRDGTHQRYRSGDQR